MVISIAKFYVTPPLQMIMSLSMLHCMSLHHVIIIVTLHIITLFRYFIVNATLYVNHHVIALCLDQCYIVRHIATSYRYDIISAILYVTPPRHSVMYQCCTARHTTTPYRYVIIVATLRVTPPRHSVVSLALLHCMSGGLMPVVQSTVVVYGHSPVTLK